MTSMNVYALGASRNIGYFSCIRLLAKGATITFLLRSTEGLEADEAIRPYIQSGHARLVKGDVMVTDDVAKGWSVAQENGARPVDVVLNTVGTYPKVSLTKGIYMTPHNLVTQGLLNIFTTFPSASQPSPPKIITLSSIGLTPASHANLPFLMKPFYGSLLASAHDDKLGSELIALSAAGQPWPSADPLPKAHIMPDGWKDALEKTGVVWPDLVIIRPALLTDGACKGDKPQAGKQPYRYSEQDLGNGYTVSRKDVAHFIVEVLLEDWAKFSGKGWSLGY